MKARDPKWWDGFSFGTEIFQSFGRLSFTFRGLKRKKHLLMSIWWLINCIKSMEWLGFT